MAEGARLESVYTLTGIVGSNPTLSAIHWAVPSGHSSNHRQRLQVGKRLPNTWASQSRFAQRWAKDGMPVQRKGLSMTAKPEELSKWLGQEAGAAASGRRQERQLATLKNQQPTSLVSVDYQRANGSISKNRGGSSCRERTDHK